MTVYSTGSFPVTGHRPSGSMCQTCIRATMDCSHMAFHEMKVIRREKDGTLVVKCDQYQKKGNQ